MTPAKPEKFEFDLCLVLEYISLIIKCLIYNKYTNYLITKLLIKVKLINKIRFLDSLTVTVEDNISPVLTCPSDRNEDVDLFDNFTIPDYTGLATVSDNCTASPLLSQLPVAGTVVNGVGTIHTITITATDSEGNSSQCSFDITLVDPFTLSITCPGDQTEDLDLNCDFVLPDYTSLASTTGAVSVDQLPAIGTIVSGHGTVVEITLIALDGGGATEQCTFDVNLEDNIAPTASNPAPINVQCASDVPAPDVSVVTDEADNCSTDPVVAHVSDVSDGNSCPETITRTYSVTDDCGNSINVVQTITIDDDTDPTASNPAPINVQCASDVPAPDVSVVTDEADNCSTDPVVAHVSDVSDGNSCPETITRTYSVTDDCGNSINVVQTITIDDDTDPTASNPAPINVQCASDVPAPDVSVVTDEADNCSTDPVVAHVSDVSDGNSCPETITRTYSVTDDCGNSINVVQTITIDDDTNPTASNPAPVNVQCIGDVPAADITDVQNAADNCTANPVVAHVSDVSDGNSCPEVITRTYSVTDDCGNSINVSQTITIDDNTDPTADPLPAIDVQCAADVPAVDINDVQNAADNCTANPVVAHVSDVSDGNSCPETITRTYSVTDDCGNSINVVQTITIDDDTDPTASNPAPINGQCASDVPAPDVSVVTDEADNCTSDPVVAHVSDVSDGNSCPETITRTYSVTDDCGNSINVSQTITIDDDTDPTADPLPAIDVQCAADVPAVDINDVQNAADNCTANPVVVHVSDVSDGNNCPEVITRTYSVTDDCGNSINVVQTITIDDDTDPTADPLPAIDVQCAADVPAVDITDVQNAADNCTANPVVAHVSDVSDGNTCPEVITRTYSVTDDCGNSINVVQTISIDDDTDPTADPLPAIDVQCAADVPAVDINDVQNAADNCTANPVVAHVSDVSDGNSCPETITRTYSVTDDCGNSINVSQTITIDDDTDPVAICKDITVPLDGTGNVSIVAADIDFNSSDNCGIVSRSIDISDFDCDDLGPNLVELTVTDACGNSSTCTSTVTVEDNISPVLTCPSDRNEDVDLFDNFTIPDYTSLATVSDNCTASPLLSQLPVAGTVVNGVGTIHTITITATDSEGNSSQCSFDITLVDPFTLSITCPGDQTEDLDLNCDFVLPDYTSLASTTGAVSVDQLPAIGTIVSGHGTAVEITLIALDGGGATEQCTFDVNLEDNIAPTASNPAPINVQCASDVPAPDVSVVTDEADNCSTDPVVAHVSDVSDGNTCPEVITRTYSVTDDCGNSINVVQTITIDDDTDPTASNPAPINVQCASDVPAPDVSVVTDEADNCSTDPVVAHVSDVSDGNSCPETITRTYSVTDDCGNSINVVQTITIDDDTDPTASNPAPINVQCASDVPAPDVSVVTDEADNCSTDPLVVHVSDVSDGNSCPETITRTYSVTDDCGNSINVSQTITIDDDTDPTADPLPAIDVQCAADVPAVDINDVQNAADNCTANPVVAHVSDVSDGNSCPETITRTYSVTDDCGNSINVVQTITIDDDTDPTADPLPAIDVQCAADVPAVDINDVQNAADNCTANPVVAHVSDVSDGNSCPETITRTYSVTDDCGNSINVVQTITIDDDTDPTADPLTAIDVQCTADVPAVDITDVQNAADNCTTNPVVAHVSDVSDGNSCPETITRTYSVTDDCGNSINVSQTITIDDDTDPTASNPAPINVQCASDVPAPDVSVVTDEADNCSTDPVVAHVSDVSDGNSCPEVITRTYSVTDDCGNSINVSQTITIDDDTDPTADPLPAIDVQCAADLPAVDINDVQNAADNCTANPVVAHVSDVSDGNTCPEVITRTYSVTDDCGNSINVVQTITIDDDTDPTADPLPAIDVQCAADVPAVDINDVQNAADNCTANPVVAHVSDVSDGNSCPETITRTYSVTDDCGNSINVVQTITIDDDTDPTADPLAPIAVQCAADVPPADINDLQNVVDNCSTDPVVVHVGDESDGNSCPEVITRIYSVTDDCGNSINVVQTITIDDDTDPTADPLPAIDVQCAADVPAVDINDVQNAADNCTANPVVAHVSDVSDGNTCPEVITRTYSVTDDCGNSIEVVQTITLNDDTDPTADPLPAIDVQCAADLPAVDINDVQNAADNCTANPVVAHVSDVSDGNSCPEVITRTYSVTDDCGNSINVSQTITIDDDTDPTASNPAPINVQCASDVPAPDVSVVTDQADNCSTDPVVVHVSDVSDGNTCPEVITRTYSVTDDCGNSINVSQTITIDDDTDPVAICKDITVPLDGTGNVSIVAADIDFNSSDNCGIVSRSIDISDFDCDDLGSNLVELTVTDACGNSSTCTSTVTVEDNISPVLTCPSDRNEDVDLFDNFTIPDYTSLATVSDNCTASPLLSQLPVAGMVVNGVGTIHTITITATDSEGNSSQCSFDITLVDPFTLSITCPGDQTEDLDLNCDFVLPDYTSLASTTGAVSVDQLPAIGTIVSGHGTAVEITLIALDGGGATEQCTFDVNLEDNIAPTASNPAPINVQCASDVPAPDVSVVTDEADNCSTDPVVVHVSDVSDGNSCPETITRTYSVTDDCGNSINVVQTITIDDDTDPTADPLPAIDVQCAADVPAVDINDVQNAADNCTANPVVAHVSDVSDGNSCPETITRTYSVTDDCGNSINVVQTITIDDDTDPTASNPAPINVQCASDVPAPDVSVVTDEADNCTTDPVVAHVSDVSDGNTCPEVITRTYSVTDDCGNSINVVQTITIDDDTDPTASNPAPINVQCASDVPAPDVSVVTDEADNCSTDPVVAHVSDVSDGNSCPEVITRTYSVTDDCGNSINVSQTITIDDDTDPTADPLPAIDVQCAADLPAVDINDVQNAADNCTANPVVAHVSDVSDGNTCPEVITRTYSVTDDCGNSINVVQTITIDDDTDPTADPLPAIDVQCAADVPTVDINDVQNAADNCTANPVVAHVSDVSDGNSCPETITRTYSVTDDCGNSINVVQTITIDDDTDPTADPLAPIAVQCAADVPPADINDLQNVVDNCSTDPVVVHVGDESDGNSCPEVITRIYSVTDDCGNSINVVQTITIDDDTDPIFNEDLPIDVTEECDAVTPPVILTATDNCDSDVTVSFTEERTDDSCEDTYTLTRTWVAEDNCGNRTSYTQIVTVEDNTAPVAICKDTNIFLDFNGLASIQPSDIDEGSFDNCSIESITVSQLTFDCTDIGVNEVTLTVADNCGNTSTCEAIVTVLDTIVPTIICAPDIYKEADLGVCETFVNVVAPETNDICGVASVTNDYNYTADASDVYPVGTTTITWTVIDAAGNTATCTQNIIVTDNENPTITCAADQSQTADAGVCEAAVIVIAPTTADNCAVATVENDYNGTADASGTYPVGTTTVTWTVTDNSGNTAACSQDITVTDDELPTITCAANQSQTADAGVCQAEVTVVAPVTTDNCGVASVINDFNGTADASGTYPVGTTTVTWTATDNSGNIATCTQDITVTDDENPTINCATDQSQTADAGLCYAAVSVVAPVTADNCGVDIVLNDYNGTENASDTYPVGATTVIWTVTDINGQVATCSQIITVTDDEIPTFTAPEDITIYSDLDCNYNADPAITGDVIDEADNCEVDEATYSDEIDTTDPCAILILRTWSLVDNSGNPATNQQQIITVLDTIPPTASNPEPLVLQCISEVPTPDINVVTDEADNCTEKPIVAFVSDEVDDNNPPEMVIRTYSVTDDCGNSILVNQTITINDNTPPEAICQSISVNLDEDGLASIEPADIDGGSSDNCSEVFLEASPLNFDCSNVGVNEVTLTVTDFSGNSSSCTTLVIVNDVDAPILTCPDNQELFIGSGCQVELPDYSNFLSIEENCGIKSIDQIPSAGTIFTPSETGIYPITFLVIDVNGLRSTCSFDVEVRDLEAFNIIDVEYTDVTCSGDSDATITVITTGGPSGLNYFISSDVFNDSNTTGIFTDLMPGNYTISVENINGCETIWPEIIEINNPVVLEAEIETVDVNCFGQSNGKITIIASGGVPAYEYRINSGIWQTDNEFEDLEAGDYIVEIRDFNGCNILSESSIFQPELLEITDVEVLNVETCNGDSTGSISIFAQGGTGLLTYTLSWEDSFETNINGIFSDLPAGSYFVGVTDENGCEAGFSSPFIIEEPIGILIVDLNITNVTQCIGVPDGSINIEAIGGEGELEYSIDGGINWLNHGLITSLDIGSYIVMVQDELGCIISYENNPVIVNGPDPLIIESIIAFNNTCYQSNDGRIIINAPDATEYSINDGFDWQTSPVFENLSAGEYQVSVKGDNGCAFDYEELISILEPEEIVIDEVIITDLSCDGDLGTIDIRIASNPSQILYSIDGGTTFSDDPLFEDLPAGKYNIILSSGIDCNVPFEGNPVVVGNDNVFPIDISINSGDAICTFSDIYLEAQANGATQYNWSTGDVGSVTIVQSNTAGPQLYWCEVLRNDGCINTDTIEVNFNPMPVVDIVLENEQVAYCLQQEVYLAATSTSETVSYYWPAYGISEDRITVVSSEEGSVEYIVEAENEFLCVNKDTITIEYESCISESTSINIEIYPSPTNGLFNLRIKGAKEEMEIFIYDAIGHEISSRLIENNKLSILELSFDLSNRATGVYYVKVSQGKEQSAVKEVVKIKM
jgi:hypothetical protein